MFSFSLMSFALFYAFCDSTTKHLKYIILLPWKHFHLYSLKSNSFLLFCFLFASRSSRKISKLAIKQQTLTLSIQLTYTEP